MVVSQTGGKQQRVSGNACFSENDWLSNLPDDILLKILEMLPLEEAMSTSLLARRWKNVWKSTSLIEVDERVEEDGRKKGSRFLKKLIRLYQGEKLKRFSVSLKYKGKMRATYKSWMAFAVSKNVEELSLELYICESDWRRKPYPIVPLPGDLFYCSSLVRVKLTFANLDPLPPFHLKLLRDLHLHKCQLPDDGVERMTANCPLLHTLDLSNCNKNRDLKITIAPDSIISKLIIDDRDGCIKRWKTSINAPKITALEIFANNFLSKYFIDNVPDTVEASLSFEAKCGAIYARGYVYQIIMDVARVREQLHPAQMLRLCTRSSLVSMLFKRYTLRSIH